MGTPEPSAGKSRNYVEGERAVKAKDYAKAVPLLERALKEVKTRTVVLDVYISPDEKVFPMVPAGKALDEIIVDMA